MVWWQTTMYLTEIFMQHKLLFIWLIANKTTFYINRTYSYYEFYRKILWNHIKSHTYFCSPIKTNDTQFIFVGDVYLQLPLSPYILSASNNLLLIKSAVPLTTPAIFISNLPQSFQGPSCTINFDLSIVWGVAMCGEHIKKVNVPS